MPLSIRNLSPSDVLGEETTLWKYLTFEKFLDFLLMKRLYFRRVDKLGDPYECLMPPELYLASQPEKTPEAQERFIADHERYLTRERIKVFVNCWHINEYESEAMWKLFGGSGHSIAITSTFSGLMGQLAAHDITAGKVLYKDVIKDDCVISDIFDFALLKRKPFEHEREFRLVFINNDGEHSPKLLDDYGLHIPVEPAAMIENIYVSPLSEPWQLELTQTIIAAQGLSDRVIKSTLFNHPAMRK
jgi:hypothetical protein